MNRLLLIAALLIFGKPAFAHVGTASVFVQGKAGPYAMYVTVTPPPVIPGEAQVSVLCDDAALKSMSVQANVLAGLSARNMPEGQALAPGPPGSHEFHGAVWIMTQGSWQVRLTAFGSGGEGTLAVPLPASPVKLMRMSRPFGALLLVLGLVLIAAVAAIAAAALREAATEPGAEPSAADARHGRMAAAITVGMVAVILLAGHHLWQQEITRYTQNIYQPLAMTVTVGGDVLHLRLRPPLTAKELFSSRRLDDLVLDHDHLMHLYMIRWPGMDVVYHVHPEQVSAGDFDLTLPSVVPGDYRLFADIVHADGFPETASGAMHLDAAIGVAPAADDAGGPLPEFPQRPADTIALADGYHYEFNVDSPQRNASGQGLRANTPVVLRFTLLDRAGRPPADMQNYMGMLGHVAVLRSDGSVFAHIHPEGSAAMAATMMAEAAAGKPRNMTSASAGPLPNSAGFPFGFPSAGTYRLIVQMKHGQNVETGSTDVVVR